MRLTLIIPVAALLGCAHSNTQPAAQASEPIPTSVAAAEKACPSVRVHFALDSSELTADSQAALDHAAACLSANPNDKVSIQGNTDERGSAEYNRALGERRASAVENYLASKGVASAQLGTMSFGKDNPLCSESDKECWQRNRRAAIEPACRM
jgi:peptidoglycan-associated lipoprotein